MSHPFATLTPDLVLDAVESLGLLSDARVLALNGYENRVYQVGIEGEAPLIAKFYRPGRWSDAAIREEHAFAFELAEHEVPLVAPLQYAGDSLFEHAGFRFALFPRRGGHAPEPGDLDQLYRFGQLLGRLHAIGASRPFVHREALTVDSFGRQSLATLQDGGFIPRPCAPTTARWPRRCWRASMRCSPACPIGRSACTATATPATCCTATSASTSSTSTTAAWDRRCRICGCCWPATATNASASSAS